MSAKLAEGEKAERKVELTRKKLRGKNFGCKASCGGWKVQGKLRLK